MKLSELFEGDGIGKPAKNLWSHEVCKDSRVASAGPWLPLPIGFDCLPDVAGVYLFGCICTNPTGIQVRYVGKAGAGRLNAEARAAARSRAKDSGASHIIWLVTNDDDSACSLERDLIDRFLPPNN